MPEAQSESGLTAGFLIQRLKLLPAVYRIGVAVSFSLLTVALSVTPGIATPDDSVFNWIVLNTATAVQKTMHIVIYAVLAILWIWSFPALSRRYRIVLSLGITAGLGIALEWYQTMVPGRFGSLFDILLNLAGSLIGLLLALLIL